VVRKTDINDRLVRFAWWTLAIIVLGLVLAIRIRLLGIPLERDEGEYAYAGQLTLQGIPPYKLAYSMKFPGTFTKCAPAEINVALISSPMRCRLVGCGMPGGKPLPTQSDTRSTPADQPTL